MATIESTRTAPFGAVTILRVVNLFSNTFAAIAAARKENQTRKTLASLSNSQLDDIGLMPGDIANVARRTTLLH